jgi:alginate O-acetyltransferase complex protein AlgI
VRAGWVLFRSDTLTVAVQYFEALAGRRGTADAAWLLREEMMVPYNLTMLGLGLGVVFLMPNTQTLLRVLTPWKVVASLLLLVLAVAMMFTQGFNPFLYFQF